MFPKAVYCGYSAWMTNLVSDDNQEKYVEVPAGEVTATALRGLIEAFVLREGTDYGDMEFNLQQKVQHVQKQLDAGDITIVFNTELQSADLLTRTEFNRLAREVNYQQQSEL